jgi:transcriptional regulator with XRE-family HTH domain
MKRPAPEGFVTMLRDLMAKRQISLNQLADRAGISAAFLSRILNRERSLPSDKTIVRLAEILDLEPAECLLIEAGRVPEEFKPTLSRPQIPALLRATGKLSDSEMQELVKMAQSLALRQRRRRKQNDKER